MDTTHTTGTLIYSQMWHAARRCLALAVTMGVASGCTAAVYHPLPAAPLSPPPAPAADTAALNTRLAAAASAAFPEEAPAHDYQLGSEDLLQITLYNVAANEQGVMPRTVDVRVSQQGHITMPLLGELAVAGQTPAWVETQLRAQYRTYYVDPQISVFVREYRSQRASVLGAVQRPGVFELSGPKTVVDLLALAGGVS